VFSSDPLRTGDSLWAIAQHFLMAANRADAASATPAETAETAQVKTAIFTKVFMDDFPSPFAASANGMPTVTFEQDIFNYLYRSCKLTIAVAFGSG